MAVDNMNIQLNEMAPMDNPNDAIPLNIKALHDTLILTQQALRKLQEQIEENHP